MKRLLFVLLLISSVASAQTIDTVLTTDTPNQGRVKINAAMQKLYGYRVDTTGLADATRPILVLQGDSMWVVKDGVINGATQYRQLYMATDDSIASLPQSIYNVKVYGAVGNGSTSDLAAIRSAIAAADSGSIIHFPRGRYVITDTLLINKNRVTLEGDGATIVQTTAGAKMFRVSGNYVTFRNITLIGDTAGSYTNNPDSSVGIDFAKGSVGHVVENCDLSLLDIGIYCHRVNNITIRNNYIHDVYQGVVGGYLSIVDRLNGVSSYMIYGNRIHCAFGPLEYSRPIWLPYSDNFIVTDNELRGGGMAFEALTTSTAETTLFVKIFSGNSCDAAASGPSLVDGNVFDTHYAPAGRGPQSGYFQAIEVGFRGTVSNNVIRNFNVGVGNTARLGRIVNNIFEACGDSVAPGADGVVVVSPYTAKDTSGAVITGNTFVGSNMADIAVNWAAGTDTVYDVIVSNNYSLNSRNEFLKSTRTQGILVSGNIVRNANKGDSSDQAYAVRLGGGVKGYVDALSVENSLASPYGTMNAVAANTGVVIGFSRVKGLRGSQAYDISGGAKVIGRTEVNGTISAVTFENMAVHGTNPVISIEQSNGSGTPNLIIYDSTLTKYAQYKLDVDNSRAYYNVASGMTHYWNVGSTNIAYWTATRLRSNVEHLFVGPILALDNYKILNKSASDYLPVITRDTSKTEATANLGAVGKVAFWTSGATTTVDSVKISGGNLVFYVGGTPYKAVP